MLNRADNPYIESSGATLVAADPNFDRRPGLRIVMLFGAIFFSIAVVSFRLVYVQTQLADDYTSDFDKLVEKLEPIPSHDGRIIAAGGEILAEDQQVFGLKVHYRWLEEPPDSAWLKSLALSRLDRLSRRNRQKVEESQAEVLQMRDQLWQDLSRSTGLKQKVLSQKRREIQKRVEKIYRLVDDRRRETAEQALAAKNVPAEDLGLWSSLWNAIASALTTPPVREAIEPLVIREQQYYHLLVADLSFERAVEIETHPEVYPGTRISVESHRVYPHSQSAPHVVGYRTLVDDDVLQERRRQFPDGDPLDYQSTDRIGRAGLERQYERQLRGLRGERKLFLNRRGEVVKTEVIREPRYGQDLVLSLHLPLQKEAERLLDERLSREHFDETNGKPLPIPGGGVIVALDVRTGAVLAAASAPRFDLNLFIDHDEQVWNEVLTDARKPLFHRGTEMSLPPGSVFKVLSAIAFIESGRLDPDRPFHCQGYLDQPDRYRCLIFRNFGASHGEVTLVEALARSCNVYFFDAARRIGASPIAEWGAKMGFGQPTGIDLPGERSGNLPTHFTPNSSKRGADRSNGDALQLAIGQAQLTTTPLQIARLLGAIANGGKLVTPRLVESNGPAQFDDGTSRTDELTTKAAIDVGLSPRTVQVIRRGLEAVVADPHGTGYKTIRLPNISIAGKTGTAEAGRNKTDHAWFAGYVPAERPKIAFVVVLENAGSGGHAAGPVARQFVQALLANGLIAETRRGPSAN